MPATHDLTRVAPAFVEMAHQIVWCTVSTVDRQGRPRSRVLHPYWTWDGLMLEGWVGTMMTPLKKAHLERNPYVSCSYWTPSQDTAVAECQADWMLDEQTRTRVWTFFKSTPEPLGYDPGGIGVPGWDSPTSPGFVVLRLRPWRLRVFPSSITRGEGGELMVWQDE
ncbi:MAG: pyridoxamine 5'-phosphate oxidase family protein [Chloroflexi bacterium]|nr:pyridoxamine 5'-phosphate oxidase family protein [Chloroflexota bacterium]